MNDFTQSLKIFLEQCYILCTAVSFKKLLAVLFQSASKDSTHKLLRGDLEFIWEWFCKLLIVYENSSTSALSLPCLVHIHNFFGVCYM